MKKVMIISLVMLMGILTISHPVLNACNGLLPVRGCGTSVLQFDMDPETPDAVGSVVMMVGDTEYEFDLEVFILGQEEKGKTIHADATHIMSNDEVAFSTSDKEKLIPTKVPGVFKVNSESKVIEGGKGHLSFHGTINMMTLEVEFEIKGAIMLD